VVTAVRLLPAARGSAGFTPPAFPVTTMTASPHGGWVQVVSPRAYYANGYTYFGEVNGSSGDIELYSYRHSTGTVSSPFVLHAALEVDTHDGPVVILRASDSRLLAFYTKHDTENKIYQRVSTNPNDASAFGTETTIIPSGGTTLTYPSVVQLTSEASQPIDLYYRDEQSSGTTGVMAKVRSTDGGVTWGSQTAVYKKASAQSYWVVYSLGTNRVDFAISDGNGVVDDPVNIYHMYYQGGSYYRSDGALITTAQPFGTADLTLVYSSATAGPGWPSGIARDLSGHVAIVYEVATHRTGGLGDQYSIRYAWWNGSSWTSNVITTSVDTGLSIVNHSCLDTSALGTAYVAPAVSGVFEMRRYDTTDNGATWTPTTLTSGSAGTGNIYPAPISRRSSGLRVLWLFGTYTTYLSNALGIKGAG
jgi:hypothetical protein